MRRFISVWLPHWPTDRWRRQRNNAAPHAPLALIQRTSGGIRLTAVDALAAAEGLMPGIRLADARALVPELVNGDADPVADQEALQTLCDWCSRFTPWAATDGDDGLILDVSGVPHLFGGEAAMLQTMRQAFARLGIDARLAIADTPAAAWAWARHGRGDVLPPGSGLDQLGPLPVDALRLAEDIAGDLRRLGLTTIAALAKLPRAPLTRRFGPQPVERLDRLFGRSEEPISPRLVPALAAPGSGALQMCADPGRTEPHPRCRRHGAAASARGSVQPAGTASARRTAACHAQLPRRWPCAEPAHRHQRRQPQPGASLP